MNEDKLKSTHDATIEIEEKIRDNVTKFVTKFISHRIEGIGGPEGAIARAATDALNNLLVSEILNPISKQLTASLVLLEVPGGDYLRTLEDGLGKIQHEYFNTFIPEIAKTYAKLGLTEILNFATSDSSPAWAAAIRSVGNGVLGPVIDNLVFNYFAKVGSEHVDIFKSIEFNEVFGKAIAGLLIDFEAIDKTLLDDFLGLDGHSKIEKMVHDLLSGQIKDFVEHQFAEGVEFLAGKFDADDLAKFFRDFADFDVQHILGNFFTSFAGGKLAELFVEIDSLPEALLSQLGATIASGALGEAMGAFAMEALTGLFGEATASALGGAIFDGLFSILGAGVGAIAGSVIFELLDDLFDGAISSIFGGIIDWIRNDSPQAYYRTEFDPADNAFHGAYLYSKDSESDLRLAVQKTMEAFEAKINAVIAFVDQPASFDPNFDLVTFVWGKKHFNESYASYITGNEGNKLSYDKSAEHVAKETVGAVLSHMNFHEGHPITALAFDMWKAGVAAGGGSALSYFADANLLTLQNLVGLAHFANDYRQDPTFYDLLMASDAPMAVTILHQYLEADAKGFNAPTILEGRVLGFQIIGSASAGDTLILNGPAWQAIARGGDDVIVAGLAPLQIVDGGSGADTLVLAKGRDAYLGSVTDDSSRTVLLTDIATGARINVTGVETFRFNGIALSFEQAFPNHAPVITSNGAADRAAIRIASGSVFVTTVTSSDADAGPRTYSITGGADASLFAIDPVTGALRFISAANVDAPLDGDRDNLYEVRVSASDGRARDEQTLSIEVTLPVDGNSIRGTPGSDILEFGQRPTPAPAPTNRDDLIYGGGGSDRISAGPGADRVHGGEGSDILRGGDGDDRLFGGRGADQIDGEAGNDVIDGGAAADRLAGGPGDDTYIIDDTADTVIEGASEGAADRIITSVSYTLGAGVYVEFLSTMDDSGTVPLILAGNELDNRITGNAGANLLYGMGGTDRLEGLAGDDRYFVDRAGDMVVEAAGQGYDMVYSPVSYGLAAGSEVEVLSALDRTGTQAIDFTGNEYRNTLYGNAGANRLSGGAGNDTLGGGAGDDRLDGGADIDTASYADASSAVTVSLALVTAQNTGGAGTDTLIDVENLLGSGFADILTGNDFANILSGGAGADTMRGGGGDDVYGVDDSGDIVEENVGAGLDEVRTSLAAYSLLGTNLENLKALNDATHDFRGNSADNVLTGGGGADLLRLYDGGNDTVMAGAGNDNIFFIGSLTSADIVNGGDGSDTLVLQGPYGALTLTTNISLIENISILGGGNTNFGEPGTNRYDYGLTTNDSNFAAGVQARINGSALLAGEDFTFNGSAETNASFVVYGGKGKDTLTGGLGNDIFFFAEERFASGDTVNGGSGYDGMFLRGNYVIDFTVPGYTGLFTSIENLTLTSATDERYARGGGAEFDYNLKLSNLLVGAAQVLTVSGTTLTANETMILDGSQETNGFLRLFGGKANDTLKGGGQADLLHGNLGADTLAGGGGADTFRYDLAAESNAASRDQILDFTPGTDKIDLSRIDARTDLAGDQAFAWIGSSAFSGSAGQLRAFQQGGTWILEGDVNGDRVADLVIALTLQGPTPIGAGDFLL